jgi:hypothetical protein
MVTRLVVLEWLGLALPAAVYFAYVCPALASASSSPLLGAFAAAAVAALLASYSSAFLHMALADPGRIPRGTVAGLPQRTLPSPRTATLHLGEGTLFSHCATCDVYRDSTTKHCRSCDACVAGLDHHCNFVNQCVTRSNARTFWCILATQALYQVCVAAFCVAHLAAVLLLNQGSGVDGGGGSGGNVTAHPLSRSEVGVGNLTRRKAAEAVAAGEVGVASGVAGMSGAAGEAREGVAALAGLTAGVAHVASLGLAGLTGVAGDAAVKQAALGKAGTLPSTTSGPSPSIPSRPSTAVWFQEYGALFGAGVAVLVFACATMRFDGTTLWVAVRVVCGVCVLGDAVALYVLSVPQGPHVSVVSLFVLAQALIVASLMVPVACSQTMRLRAFMRRSRPQPLPPEESAEACEAAGVGVGVDGMVGGIGEGGGGVLVIAEASTQPEMAIVDMPGVS